MCLWTPRCSSSALSVTRTDERTTQRNGYRERNWQTRVGDAVPRSPRNPQRLILPSFRAASSALSVTPLLAVIQHALRSRASAARKGWMIWSRRLAWSGIDPEHNCARDLAGRARQRRERLPQPATRRRSFRMSGRRALYLKCAVWIVSVAVVIAIGVKESGERRILIWTSASERV